MTANGPRGTRHSGFSAGQYANEHEGHDDLHEDHRHEQQRPAGQELLRAGNGGRQKREIREVAEADECEQSDVPSDSRSDMALDVQNSTAYEFTSTSSSVATHEQRNCRSSGKVLNLKIVLDSFCGAISPMAKCWTTKAGHARCGRRLATVSGFSEGVAPEGTPQRLCPHSPVLSNNDGLPTTKSVAMLASPMQ